MDPSRNFLLQLIRTTKLVIVSCIYGNLFLDVFYGYRPSIDIVDFNQKRFFLVLILILLGLRVTILQRPKLVMGKMSFKWMMVAHSKLIVTIIVLTPIYDQFMSLLHVPVRTRGIVQLVILTLMIALSSGLKFYREACTQHSDSYKEFKHS